MGLPYPDNLTPLEGDLKLIAINEYWFSVLMGYADNALTREDWEVTDAEWVDVYQAILTMLTAGSDVSILTDVRLNEDGSLQKKYAADWMPAGDVSIIDSATATTLSAGSSATAEIDGDTLELGIPRGNTGAVGATGETGADGLDGIAVKFGSGLAGRPVTDIIEPSETPEDPTDAAISSACLTLGDYLFNQLNLLVAIAVRSKEMEISKTGVLFEIVDAVGSLPAVDEFGVDAALNVAEGIVSLIQSSELSDLTGDAIAAQPLQIRDDLACAVFCLILDREDKSLTQEDYDDFILPAVSSRLRSYIENYDIGRLNYYLNVGFRDEDPRLLGLCEACGFDWEYTWDFTEGDGGWEITGGGYGGVYVPATGWSLTDQHPSAYVRSANIHRVGWGSREIVYTKLVYDRTGGGTDDPSRLAVAVGTPVVNEAITMGAAGDGVGLQLVSSGSGTATELVAFLQSDDNDEGAGGFTGSGLITSYTVRGRGENPFE